MDKKTIEATTEAPLHLLPAMTSIFGAMACLDGANKDGAYHWRENPISLMEHLGAVERHIARMKDGENVDPKSGVPHLGHIIAIAGILLDAEACETRIDDRPKVPGRAADILDGLAESLKGKPSSEWKIDSNFTDTEKLT